MACYGFKRGFAAGTVAFATAGPGTRSTQMFVNLGDNTHLHGLGLAPFAKVVKGLDVFEQLFAGSVE